MRKLAPRVDREAGSKVLDEVVTQITEQLQAGKPFHLQDYVRQYPDLEDQLRRLFPGIQTVLAKKSRMENRRK